MNNYHYVYTLQSLALPTQLYTGHTHDLHQRLKEHNAGKVPHTSKFTPWTIRTATAFRDKNRALTFERYLKSGSGRAFLRRHLRNDNYSLPVTTIISFRWFRVIVVSCGFPRWA